MPLALIPSISTSGAPGKWVVCPTASCWHIGRFWCQSPRWLTICPEVAVFLQSFCETSGVLLRGMVNVLVCLCDGPMLTRQHSLGSFGSFSLHSVVLVCGCHSTAWCSLSLFPLIATMGKLLKGSQKVHGSVQGKFATDSNAGNLRNSCESGNAGFGTDSIYGR